MCQRKPGFPVIRARARKWASYNTNTQTSVVGVENRRLSTVLGYVCRLDSPMLALVSPDVECVERSEVVAWHVCGFVVPAVLDFSTRQNAGTTGLAHP